MNRINGMPVDNRQLLKERATKKSDASKLNEVKMDFNKSFAHLKKKKRREN